MSIEKLCVNCKHYRPILITPGLKPKGKCLVTYDIDLVSGHKTYYDASDSRKYNNTYCGFEGSKYEYGKTTMLPIIVDKEDILYITYENLTSFAFCYILIYVISVALVVGGKK